MTSRGYSRIAILLLLATDQLAKYFFYTQEIGSQTPFLQPLFNPGISRGIAMPLAVTISISLICIAIFGYLFQKKQLTIREYSLFIAGTVGNLIDRILLGGVRDFINIQLFHFPIFNGADCFLTIAVILLIIRQIFSCKSSGKR